MTDRSSDEECKMSDLDKAKARIAELEAALADYARQYGLSKTARRLLIEDPYTDGAGTSKRP
ncbi:hypothetical protein [Palleronia abyssalis]|uniref:Uncharacterized protein n=1 Tax=Palleronia abyssalis TaxID=1501240 RepID=A0A2R8BZF3_9RHOB|nr:hypothetical protein [Palleronia abyssalis]SPJ25476.1 hypothetical protein PAA8504_03327 [Palleronia abyssalis]